MHSYSVNLTESIVALNELPVVVDFPLFRCFLCS